MSQTRNIIEIKSTWTRADEKSGPGLFNQNWSVHISPPITSASDNGQFVSIDGKWRRG